MFAFLERDLSAGGRVLYPGAIPPTFEQLSQRLKPANVTPANPAAEHVWAADAKHPNWGVAEIVCLRRPAPLAPEIIDHTATLSTDEKALARGGHATVAVRVPAHEKQILRDRKRLLFWLRALMRADAAIAIDDVSTLLWSHAMLDDELAHDADLDVESLYALHAVHDSENSSQVEWLHTHGLEALGAFDIDALQPSRAFVESCADAFRALAFAALERTISPESDRFTLAFPGGDVRLVPADRFQRHAAPEHAKLREHDAAHSGRRAVLCEPVGALLSIWRSRPAPSRFLSELLRADDLVFPFSATASAMMAERARQTLPLFRQLREEFANPDRHALVKLGYEVEGGTASDREHLWFMVHAFRDNTVNATLVNAPHRVPSLQEGVRAEFGLDRLTDWVLLSPEGPMTPRNITAARRLRRAPH
jgi:uncharacterized protein YegJ (DUF2314 family)